MCIWKNFCFHTNFQISWYTRIRLNYSEKNRMNKIRSRRICSFFDLKCLILLKNPIKKYTFIVFFFENESDFILQWGKPLRVTCPSLRKNYNSLNALHILWTSTSRLLRELTINDNLYPIYEKYDNICSCLYFGVYQVTCNSSHNSRIRIKWCVI